MVEWINDKTVGGLMDLEGSLKEIFDIVLKQYDMLFHCVIPVEDHVVKKNNRPIYRRHDGTPFIGKGPRLREAEEYMTLRFRSEANRAGLYSPITGNIWAVFLFRFEKNWFYTKTGAERENIADLSNLIELPQDCLQEAGVIKNDSRIVSLDLSRRLPADDYSLEVYIFRHKSSKPPITPPKKGDFDA